MRKHIQSWLPIVILLLMATIGYALRAKDALQALCRPPPKVCSPDISLPCQPIICPDADTREACPETHN